MQVVSRKRALSLVANSREKTCKIRHPMGLYHSIVWVCCYMNLLPAQVSTLSLLCSTATGIFFVLREFSTYYGILYFSRSTPIEGVFLVKRIFPLNTHCLFSFWEYIQHIDHEIYIIYIYYHEKIRVTYIPYIDIYNISIEFSHRILIVSSHGVYVICILRTRILAKY